MPQPVGHASGIQLWEIQHSKGFNQQCAAEKTARVWLQGKGGVLKPGEAAVLLPPNEGETDASPVSYRAPLRQALIDDNPGYVNVVVCAADYAALKRGIEHLAPPPQ